MMIANECNDSELIKQLEKLIGSFKPGEFKGCTLISKNQPLSLLGLQLYSLIYCLRM